MKSWILQLWSTAAETSGEAEHSQTIGDQRVNRRIKHQQQLKAVKHAETWRQRGLEKLEFVGKCAKLLRGWKQVAAQVWGGKNRRREGWTLSSILKRLGVDTGESSYLASQNRNTHSQNSLTACWSKTGEKKSQIQTNQANVAARFRPTRLTYSSLQFEQCWEVIWTPQPLTDCPIGCNRVQPH